MTRMIADLFAIQMPMFYPDGDGGGGDANTGNPGPGGDGNNTPGADASQNPKPNAGKGGDGNDGTPPPDRRHAGMLKDLQNERAARQQTEQTVAKLQRDLEQATKRIHALAGVNTPSEQDADEAAIKEALIKRFPALGKLTDEAVDRLLGLTEKADAIEESNLRQWTNHARGMLDGVVDGVEKEMGGELSDRQKANLQRAYFQRAQNDEEFLERHERGDRSLISEFVKEFVEDWIAPARRQSAAIEQGRRRPVPNGKDRSTVGGGAKKIDFNNPKSVEDAMVASFKEHGGTFGD